MAYTRLEFVTRTYKRDGKEIKILFFPMEVEYTEEGYEVDRYINGNEAMQESVLANWMLNNGISEIDYGFIKGSEAPRMLSHFLREDERDGTELAEERYEEYLNECISEEGIKGKRLGTLAKANFQRVEERAGRRPSRPKFSVGDRICALDNFFVYNTTVLEVSPYVNEEGEPVYFTQTITGEYDNYRDCFVDVIKYEIEPERLLEARIKYNNEADVFFANGGYLSNVDWRHYK